MTAAPRLSSADVKQRIEEIQPRRPFVAFFGSGEPDQVQTSAGIFEVVPVRSELDLRKNLPDAPDGDTRIAFLVPWSGALPLDIGAAFAQDGRILPLGRELRLRRLFGAAQVEAAARESALAKYLLEKPPAQPFAFSGGRLTLDALWATWLAAVWGVPDEGLASLEALLAWAVSSERGPNFRAVVPDEVRLDLLAHLRRRYDAAAPLVWRAWESGEERAKPLELALVFEALDESGELRMWRLLKTRELGASDADREIASRALAKAASGALRLVEGREPDRVDRLLRTAEDRADEEVVRSAMAASRSLPSGWHKRLDALGNALAQGAQTPNADALRQAIAAQRDLEAHRFFKHAAHAGVLSRADMAVKLLAWLVARPDRELRGGNSVYADVERLARWYAAEGGFVDWARRRARGSGERAFGEGVNAVVAAADAVRVEIDRTFARALPRWIEAGKPATQVLPIESAVDHFVCRFLAARGDRKVLVLLLDGMAWAQAAEILESIPSWGPLAWNFGAGRIGSTPSIAPVLASLPTVTEVSRAAFFAGKAMPAGRLDGTDKDVDRWASFAKLRPFVPPGDLPRLLLRGEGHTPDGAASREALNLVRDERHRAVAIVINAIDSSLKGDTQQDSRWTYETIRPLRDLLDAAQETGRAVLLAADHGHVPADRLQSVGSPPDSKARWRVWKRPDEPIADYEIAIEKQYAWAPAGAHGVILLADDAHRYGAAPHAGEHGGATLAEVVAPTLLVASEQLEQRALASERDPDLHVEPIPRPEWWFPSVPAEARLRPPSPTPRKRNTPAPFATPAQLPLLAVQTRHELRALLERSPVFKESHVPDPLRMQILDAVEYLARREGEQAPIGQFADAMRKLPTRAMGFVDTLSRYLNQDSYAVLSYDAAAGLVKLDAAKLRVIYG
ncbi:MAG: BREX-2 system phosphatase PglZ [Polyangiaceae bacterium]